MLDIVILDGRVIDGSGNPPYRADLGIQSGRIAAIGRLADADAARTIDARGRAVCPGFIDAHAHSDIMPLAEPRHELKVRQGVTTEIIGQDGLSYAPVSPQNLPFWRRYLKPLNGDPAGLVWDWSSVAEYLARFDGRAAVNVAYLVPHSAIRYEAMGMAHRPPTTDELAHMARLLAEGMEQGAIGLSTGLGYAPGQYADTEELIALARVAADYGGVYVSHIRDYTAHIGEAVEEIFAIGAGAGVPVHISHFIGKGPFVEQTAESARALGLELTYDLYPYLMGSTSLFGLLTQTVVIDDLDNIIARLQAPALRARLHRELAGWDWSTLYLAYAPGAEALEGRRFDQCAAEAGQDAVDFLCDLIVRTDLAAGVVTRHTFRTEDDLRQTMRPREAMFSSDGILLGSRPNPRVAGAFPRVLARYVREMGVLLLEAAIRKMTSLPAQTHRLHDRGLLKVGLAADVVVFDPDRVADHATLEDGRRPATGIDDVIVNGIVVLDEGQHTGATPGVALRRK